ncbi:hypothetical protein BHE74_00041814 [Ensete ventricosum]|nr:hypothetical protein BHE74_00041814 [Ensete ventricosum]
MSQRREMKYVLVTGGVVSGLGKGVTASSIGVVLKACGLRVTSIKIGACLAPLQVFMPYKSGLNVKHTPHNIDSGILDAGDIESMPFIEALGQFSYRVGKENLKAPLNFCYS